MPVDYFQQLLQDDNKAPGATSADVPSPVIPKAPETPAPPPMEAATQHAPEQQAAPAPAPQDPFAQLLQNSESQVQAQAANTGAPDVTEGQGSLKEPLNITPESLSSFDRAKLKGLGNEKGMVGFLKNKFEDVTVDPDKGILVKEKGLWHRMDPSGFGQYFSDPYEASKSVWEAMKKGGKEAFNDVVSDNADVAISMGTQAASVAQATAGGAAIGTAIAPGLGTAVGGAAGFLGGLATAGAASAGIRTSLGRIVGTYDATPEEQMQDIGWEAFLNMGLGAVLPVKGANGKLVTGLKGAMESAPSLISIGERPTIDQVVTAAKNLREEAPGVTKQLMAKHLGLAAKQGEDGILTIINNPSEWGQALKTATEEAAQNRATLGMGKKATPQGIQQVAGIKKIDSAQQILENGIERVTDDFGKNFEALVNSAKDQVPINFKRLVGTVGQRFQDSGLGKLVEKGGRFKFINLKPSQLASNYDAGVASEYLTDSEARIIQQLINKVSPLLKVETKTGSGSVRLLQELNKNINRFGDAIPKAEQSVAFQRIVDQVRTAFKNGISAELVDTPLEAGWKSMLQDYTKKSNAVNWARDILESAEKANIPKALQTVVDQALNSAGEKNPLVVQYLTDLVRIGGDDSLAAYKNMRIYDSVQKFAPMTTKFSLGAKLAGTAGAGGAIATAVHFLPVLSNPLVTIPAAGAALVAGASTMLPRASARIAQGLGYAAQAKNLMKIGAGNSSLKNGGVQYGFKALDMLRSLSTQGMRQLLNNPEAVKSLLESPSAAMQGEQQQTMQLLQQSGALPNQ